MSDITITTDNLSDFSKRLQKALSKHFNQEVKLSDAKTLLAKAVGKNSLHELQKVMKESPKETKAVQSFLSLKEVVKLSEYTDYPLYIQKAQTMLSFIRDYFERSIPEMDSFDKITEVTVKACLTGPFLNVEIALADGMTGDMKLRFGYPAANIADLLLEKVHLGKQDETFIRELCELFEKNEERNHLMGIIFKEYVDMALPEDEYLIATRYQKSERKSFPEKMFLVANKHFGKTYEVFCRHTNSRSFADFDDKVDFSRIVTEAMKEDVVDLLLFSDFNDACAALVDKPSEDYCLLDVNRQSDYNKNNSYGSTFFVEMVNGNPVISFFQTAEYSVNFMAYNIKKRANMAYIRGLYDASSNKNQKNPFFVNQSGYEMWNEGFVDAFKYADTAIPSLNARI